MAKQLKRLRETREYVAQLRRLTDEELSAELREHRTRLFTLRTQAVTEKVEDNSAFTATRRLAARVLSEMNARRHRAAAKA